MNKNLFLLLIVLFSFLSSSFLVYAQSQKGEKQEGLVPCGNPGQPSCTLCHLFVLFDNVLDFFLVQLVPPIAVFMIAFAGLMYIGALFEMIPGGFETVKRAKNIFSSIIIGLILIYSSWLIVSLFFRAIGLAGWTENFYSNWWREGFIEFNCQ